MQNYKLGEHSVQIPQDWEEITLRQAIALSKSGDDVSEIMAAITGIPSEITKRIKAIDVEVVFGSVLNFLKIKPDLDKMYAVKAPETFTLGDQTFSRYYKPGEMTWAQHLNFDAVAGNKDLSDLEKVAPVIAICCQQPDKYNEETQKELEQFALDLPLNISTAICGFFFRQLLNFNEQRLLKMKLSTLQIKSKQAFITLKGSGRLIPSTLLLAVILASGIWLLCYLCKMWL
jgi:hypothetical protein